MNKIIHLEKQNKKPTTTQNNTKKLDQKIPQKERENRKMIEKIIAQEQVEKSEHRESSRLRNQPRKNYKTFIPQSKILMKVEFQKQFLILKLLIFAHLNHFELSFFKITC